jgi:hypothetical protein
MQGSWITKETENIPKTRIYKWFKEKYNFKESFQIWDGKKVPFLFNDNVTFVFYIERGFLMISIYDIKKGKWCFYPFNVIKGLEDFDFKTFYEDVKKDISEDEIGSLECTQKLNYYIKIIDNHLSDLILKGHFDKIIDHMEDMTDSQIKAITQMIDGV